MPEEYTLIGTDLSGLWLQAGFVEGIMADRQQFATLAEAFRHALRRNLEYAILLWNGLPVRLSYPQDLPTMVTPLIALLQDLQQGQVLTRTSYEFRTTNVHTRWQVESDPDTITIEGFWQQVPGNYEAALNHVGIIRMPRLAFLCEWKLLLQQLIRTIADAEAVLTHPEARSELQEMRRLEARIPWRGRFYTYSTERAKAAGRQHE